jgi:UDP-N-acetylmuramate-alanine ligase
MSDKARELAERLISIFDSQYPQDHLAEATALISSALKAARLEAIEKCKDEVYTIINRSDVQAELIRRFDAVKEAKNADAK